MHPHDPDARITKMKDGRTHLAHKAEHAVDMETGVVVAVRVQPINAGDTQTVHETRHKPPSTSREQGYAALLGSTAHIWPRETTQHKHSRRRQLQTLKKRLFITPACALRSCRTLKSTYS